MQCVRLHLPVAGFSTDARRLQARLSIAVRELIRVLPTCAIAYAVGCAASWLQVGDAAELRKMAVDIFSQKPGTDAVNVVEVIGVVHTLWDHAIELPDVCFTPVVSCGLVAFLVRPRHDDIANGRRCEQ